MWYAEGKACDPRRFTSFEPEEVLYAFDGPRVFTLRDADGELNVGYWSDADGEADRYLVVPTTPATVDLLRAGALTVYEALDQPRCWACDVALAGGLIRCLRVDFDAVPRDALPAAETMVPPTLEPGAALRARRRVDDAIRRRAGDPTPVDLKGRIGQFAWDRVSFDLREIDGGQPDQEFAFEPDLLDDVFRLAREQVRVRVAGLTFPGKPIAYASVLSRL